MLRSCWPAIVQTGTETLVVVMSTEATAAALAVCTAVVHPSFLGLNFGHVLVDAVEGLDRRVEAVGFVVGQIAGLPFGSLDDGVDLSQRRISFVPEDIEQTQLVS